VERGERVVLEKKQKNTKERILRKINIRIDRQVNCTQEALTGPSYGSVHGKLGRRDGGQISRKTTQLEKRNMRDIRKSHANRKEKEEETRD